MSVLIEVLDSNGKVVSDSCILGLSGKFFDNANSKDYDVTLKDTIDLELVLAEPLNAHPELKNPFEEVEDRCIMITRGINTFTSKYEQSIKLHAAAVIIANNNTAQPSSILTLYGQIADELTHDKYKSTFHDAFPPCVMISYDSYLMLSKSLTDSRSLLKIRMRPVQAVDLTFLDLDDIGVIIRSCCIFDNHPLLLDTLAYIFHKTLPPKFPGKTENSTVLKIPIMNETDGVRLREIERIVCDVEVGRGANSLHLSVEQNNLPCVATILRAGHSTETRKDDGYTALHLAAEHCRYDVVALLLANGAYIDHPHPIGWTALHFAAYCDHINIVTLLCEQGASVNVLSIDGNSPLHVAAKIGADDCLRKMLEYSVADIFRNNGPLTVLQCAQQNNHIGCCRIIHDYSKRIKMANPAATITWTGSSKTGLPPSAPTTGRGSEFTFSRANSENNSQLLIDYWYQCCNISTQTSIINLSLSNGANLDEEIQQLISLDLERCCFVEYRSGPKSKLLKAITITILSGCKTVTYRQGLLSLLIPIIEANYYTKSYAHTISTAQNSTTEANALNKTVLMFHTLMALFPVIANYYSTNESKRNSAIPQLCQSVLPLLRWHYPMIYTALVWNEVSLLVFVVPWISTIMAHVLPLKDTMRLWSGLFELYNTKRQLLRSNASSANSSATSTPTSTQGKSPRASANNCDLFLVYLINASLKSMEDSIVNVTTSTTLIGKDSITASTLSSRNDSSNNLAAKDSSTMPTGPDNTLQKLLTSKLTSAVQTASDMIQSAPRSNSSLLISKVYSIQSDEKLFQLFSSINNATMTIQEANDKKSATEMNIFDYIDGNESNSTNNGIASPNIFTSIGNMLTAQTTFAPGIAATNPGSTASTNAASGGNSKSTVQNLLNMYYSSSSAASSNSTPTKGRLPNGSQPNTPSHLMNSSVVLLHVAPILQVTNKLFLSTDLDNAIVVAKKSFADDSSKEDLNIWESLTEDIPKMRLFPFLDLLMARSNVDQLYNVLILEVSPDLIPYANFQSSVPALHSYHLKRHPDDTRNSMTNQIKDTIFSINHDNVVEVVNVDQLQLNGLVDYLRTFAISISSGLKVNKKAKDEYMKLTTLPNLPVFLKNLLRKSTSEMCCDYVLIVPALDEGQTVYSKELLTLLDSFANTLTICGVEQVLVLTNL